MTAPTRFEEFARLFDEVTASLSAPHPSKRPATVLVEVALERMPQAEHSGISVGRHGGDFSTIAATGDIVHAVDAIQYEVGSGPCVDAISETPLLRCDDLNADARWPVFGPRAVNETGIVSMLSHRLFIELDPDTVAALNFYSRRPDAFGDTDELTAMILATHGAAVVAHAAAQDKAENLMIALKTSREIGIAMGILMNTYKLTRDQAFDVLRTHSQGLHRKLADVAMELGDTGALPPLPPPRRAVGT